MTRKKLLSGLWWFVQLQGGRVSHVACHGKMGSRSGWFLLCRVGGWCGTGFVNFDRVDEAKLSLITCRMCACQLRKHKDVWQKRK